MHKRATSLHCEPHARGLLATTGLGTLSAMPIAKTRSFQVTSYARLLPATASIMLISRKTGSDECQEIMACDLETRSVQSKLHEFHYKDCVRPLSKHLNDYETSTHLYGRAVGARRQEKLWTVQILSYQEDLLSTSHLSSKKGLDSQLCTIPQLSKRCSFLRSRYLHPGHIRVRNSLLLVVLMGYSCCIH